MPPATHRITLLSATSLASVVAVAGVQSAEAAVVYTVQVRNPTESKLSTNSTSDVLSVTDVLGNSVGTATTTTAYTLVGKTASRLVTFALRSGSQTNTTTLTVTAPTTASSANFSAVYQGALSDGSALLSSTKGQTTRNLTVSVTPTERSNGATIAGTFTATGINPANNAGSGWSYGKNVADNTNFTFQTVAVSAVASQTGNTTIYALPSKTATQAYTVQNIGDGTKAGLDTNSFKSELWGSTTSANGPSWGGSGTTFNATGSNLTDGASFTRTFTYTAASARGSSDTATITSTYTSGSTNNAGSTAVTVLTGVTVAPENATAATGTTLYALPGSTASGTFNIQNTGDGSYVGASLTGTLTTTPTTGLVGSVANGNFSLADGKAPSSPAATTLTQTMTYTGQAARGASVAATVTASFADGHTDGTNSAQTVTKVFTGQTVAPVNSTTAAPTSLGTVRVGTSSTANLTVKNTGDGNLAGADDGTTLLSNLRGNVSVSGASAITGGGAVNLTDSSSQTYMFTYAPTARGNQSATITTAFTNGSADGKNVASAASSTVTGTAVGPDFDAVVDGKNASSGAIIDGGTILFGEAVGGLTLQDLLISNLSNDVASKALTDLTLTNVTITGSTEFSFSLSGFDSGNTGGFGTSTKNAVLSNLSNGDGSGAIAIQFVNKAGSGVAQLRLETDEGAALGGAGAIYVYNLVWSVPEPGTIAVFGAGLLGLAISRQRRRGRAFVALTAKPEEETPTSAR